MADEEQKQEQSDTITTPVDEVSTLLPAESENSVEVDKPAESEPSVDKILMKQQKKIQKKAQKKAAKRGGSSAVTPDDPATLQKKQLELQEKVRSLMNQLQIRENLSQTASSSHDKETGIHKFWNTQPVPQIGEITEEDGKIEEDVPHDELRKEPYTLPKEFEWSTLELDNEEELSELYTLLTNNYVEDDEAMFRFDYSDKFLKWALMPPGYKKVWHCGVRVTSSKKLVAFISGIPADIRIYDSKQHLVEINFLCVHKRLRSKRLAPVLIKEITRRSNLEGIFQAVYTAGVVLPKPISKARYYHRSLNPKKLVETKFSVLPQNTPLARVIKKYKLPTDTLTPGLRPMRAKDVSKVRTLLNDFMNRFDFAPVFKTNEEAKHWILSKEGITWSYVVETPGTKDITDFFSYYYLPSSVINNQNHKSINACYLFYYATNVTEEKPMRERLVMLIKDALILAKKQDIDVFNCLDLMENKSFIEELKFGPGDGHLNYYMYNWRCKEMTSDKVGIVML